MKIKKRQHPRFNVPNAGARNRSRVPERWRKQRGIDSKKRVKKAFAGAEPTIGYGNPQELRGVRANGRRAMLVHNANELKSMISNQGVEEFEVTLASALSRRKKMELTKLANDNKIRVTNGVAK